MKTDMKKPTLYTVAAKAVDSFRTGRLVADYRKHHGVTQLHLANELGHRYSISVSLSESGKRGWTQKKLDAYVAAIDRCVKKISADKSTNPAGKKEEIV